MSTVGCCFNILVYKYFKDLLKTVAGLKHIVNVLECTNSNSIATQLLA